MPDDIGHRLRKKVWDVINRSCMRELLHYAAEYAMNKANDENTDVEAAIQCKAFAQYLCGKPMDMAATLVDGHDPFPPKYRIVVHRYE
jgi:hypothetical protein